jgi:hypothetical protein
MALMQKNMEFFFGRYIRNLARYVPDLEALKGRVLPAPAVGTDSAGQLAHDGGLGLARALGVETAVFPGDHGGFDGRAAEFAPRLLEVLAN